jgi:hypothetical protein
MGMRETANEGADQMDYSAKGLFREDAGRPQPFRFVLHTPIRTIIDQITIVFACMQDVFHFRLMVFALATPIGMRTCLQGLWRPPQY